MEIKDALSDVVSKIPSSGIRKFFDLANQMEDVISLGVGEPDFDTPWRIREAAIYSIERGLTFYTENQGLLALRQEISRFHRDKHHVRYDPKEEILVTVGGSEAIDLALRSLLNPGDEVIVLEPSYVAYIPSITLSGGKAVTITLQASKQFKLQPEQLRQAISDKTKAIVLNYPSNPTGGCMTQEDYEKLVPILKESGIMIISDEIYSALSYETDFCSIAAFDTIKDQVIIISGFSKSHAMTGWRLGYVCAHPIILQAMNKIHQYVVMSAPTAGQYGAIEAIKNCEAEVEQMRQSYELRRNYLVQAFNAMGLTTFLPQGAFYIFPDITATGLTSEQFCQQLLEQHAVACVPGTAFGRSGEGHIRVSYAYSIKQLKVAVQRIEQFVMNIHKI